MIFYEIFFINLSIVPFNRLKNFKIFTFIQLISMTVVGWRYPTKDIPLFKGGLNSGVVMMDLEK